MDREVTNMEEPGDGQICHKHGGLFLSYAVGVDKTVIAILYNFLNCRSVVVLQVIIIKQQLSY